MSEQPIAYEEVPGSRTTQQAIERPQRERIAYEELQPGDIIQEGDEWQNECGRWRQFLVLDGSRVQVRESQRVRRPYKISTILEIGDALDNAQKAATQLQEERDKAQLAIARVKAEFNNQAEVLAEVRADEERLVSRLELLRSEYATVQQERDLARSEVARLSTELWARKPLEDRVTSLTEELAQAREGNQQLLKTIAENADMFGDHTKALVQERNEARAERDRLQEVVNNLYSEPTARQVQQMLRTWATELDWSAGCFDSTGREQIDTIQKTLIAVMERIETMINPEGGTDGE